MTPPVTPPVERDVPDRVRMPLLTLITQQSLDEDYLVAVERRTAGVLPPPNRPSRRSRQVSAVGLVLVVFALLVTTAFVQTQRSAAATSASRTTLIERVIDQKRAVARQEQRRARLSQRAAEDQRALTAVSARAEAAQVRLTKLEVPTGFAPVTGEGVRITVTQRPNADQAQLVQDQDLAALVNGLWAAGAEAIAVNGQRLTARTAIRTSGAAIEVNGTGIAPPYTVEAIGDTKTLQARFVATTTGAYFVSLTTYGYFSYTMENVSRLTLPAAPPRMGVLRSASTDQGPRPDRSREETGP